MPPGITGPSRWLLCSVLLSVASGTGKGPIGLYAVNARLVLVAESNQDALLLVDVALGGVVARRAFDEGVSVTGVASCASCDWALVTSNRFEHVKLNRVIGYLGTAGVCLTRGARQSGQARRRTLKFTRRCISMSHRTHVACNPH